MKSDMGGAAAVFGAMEMAAKLKLPVRLIGIVPATDNCVDAKSVKPGDVVMVNSTPAGGHISHHREGSLGKFTRNIIDIPLTEDGYHMDVDKTTYLIEKARPKLIVLGKSLFFFGTHHGNCRGLPTI